MRRPDVLALILTVLPGVAAACSPSANLVMRAPAMGPDCSVNFSVEEYRGVALGPVSRTPGGLAVQHSFDGNACYWDTFMLVQDCAAGRAALIGPDSRALMRGPEETGIDRIAETLLNTDAGLERAVELAVAEGYDRPEAREAGTPLAFGDIALPTACACADMTPETTGGTD